MILTEVRDYLKTRGQAPLKDMAVHFKMQESALKPILQHWVNKGKVQKLPAGTPCGGGCSSCAPDTIEIYQWSDTDNSRQIFFSNP